MEILIKNGTIINSETSSIEDILVIDDKIVKIGKDIRVNKNCKIIDATGKYVIPGGIDPHVHMQLPTPAGPSSDDFFTGSCAALFGGTTTIIDFVTPARGHSITDALKKRRKEAEKSLTNYSLHVSPVEWRGTTEAEIKNCLKLGFNSFKVYLAYKNTVGLKDDEFELVLNTVVEHGGLVTIHCEDGDKVDELRNKFASEDNVSPLFHAKSRPAEFEALAVKKSIDLAAKYNCPIYIVHVSSVLSLEYIHQAQQTGQKVYAETCPHYLLLDDSKYLGEFNKTVPFVLSPPLRKKTDQEALWQAITTGTLQTVGTDHCPFNLEQKAVGINDFRRIPNGAGGIEHRLALLYTYGVLKHRISLNQWVDVCSTQPAKIFGLSHKGKIAVGFDADIVIWDPDFENTISVKNHHQRCDLEIFEGFKTKGLAETVIRNGRIVVDNGEMYTDTSNGNLLCR
ncbi:MAG TPA: dihydropyrimidinase [Bacteroidales bacterium]|nr:dihydropyrimidinase [Bacteroidales bacterium]